MKVSYKHQGQTRIPHPPRDIIVQNDDVTVGEGENHFSGAMWHLDLFACLWAERVNAGGLVQEIHSFDQLITLINEESPIHQEFGLILLRVALTRTIPNEANPFLEYLFGPFFERASFGIRTHICKIFLQILPYIGPELCQIVLPTGIANRVHECIDGQLSDIELSYYGDGLELLENLFEDENESEEEISDFQRE
jgi:hypothetical protein